LLVNGLNWTPRPVMQSYSVHSPALLRLNRDFFRGPAAPEFVLFRAESIDGHLPTQDDGPALLELLRRYEPRETEKEFLLLKRRAEPGPELVGERLAERQVPLSEWLDLAELGPGPKAISFQIDPSRLGGLRAFLFRPPTLFLAVKMTSGELR